MTVTRREAMVLAGNAAAAPLLASGARIAAAEAAPAAALARPALTLYARHLQWASMEEAVEVAAAAGYGAIAWAVRPGAHITPENVARDLPRAVELTHRAGLGTPLIATLISDADTAHAESIVATAAEVGIRIYRASSYAYDLTRDLPAQLEALKPRMAGLAKLNERHGATAVIHTHAGNSTVGGAVWDLWILLRDFDPERVAINFDTGYAMMGTGPGWAEAARVARRHIRTLSLKDVAWQHTTEGSPWTAAICAPGQGMVDFRAMLGYFRATEFHGAAEVSFEYSVNVPGRPAPVNLMGNNVGQWQLEMPKADFVALLKRDMNFFAAQLRATGLAPASGLSVRP